MRRGKLKITTVADRFVDIVEGLAKEVATCFGEGALDRAKHFVHCWNTLPDLLTACSRFRKAWQEQKDDEIDAALEALFAAMDTAETD